jgi:enoyl-CoA hydratase/carnithine racemase
MPIHYTVDDHVVTVTIDRPERRNALDLEHFDALADAWKRFRDDPDAWVAVVTGVDDAFCAGGDLRDYLPLLTAAYADGAPADRERFRSGTEAVLRGVELYKPVIAAINGPCVAGGMELLNGTDIRLACPEAVFGMLEPKRGLFASGGTSVLLPRQIPWAAAMELLLTAEPVPATRALEMGLLNEIVPRAQLLDRAREWATRITENAPLAVAATKESAVRGLAADSLADALHTEARISARILRTDDAREGPRAFVEKRAPRWTGR